MPKKRSPSFLIYIFKNTFCNRSLYQLIILKTKHPSKLRGQKESFKKTVIKMTN